MTIELLNEKKYDECIAIFEEKSEKDSENSTYFLNMLLCYFIVVVDMNEVKEFLAMLNDESTYDDESVIDFHDNKELTFVRKCAELYISNEISTKNVLADGYNRFQPSSENIFSAEIITEYCECCLQYDTNVKTLDEVSTRILSDIKDRMYSC